MKTLDPTFQAHLDSGATTLCWCWRLTQQDGDKIGFTDHDRDLSFDGTVFQAASGFSASEVESAVGLSVDNLDVESVLHSDLLNEEDLVAGLFDNSVVEIFRVNWSSPDQHVLMRMGNLGEVSRGTHMFRAEVRGLAHELQQPKGRIYQFGCDADLGDGRCGVDVGQATFLGTGSVNSIDGLTVFTASGLEAFSNDWFTGGLLTWTSGANLTRKMEVKLHSFLNGVVTLELWQRMAGSIAPGDLFEIQAGCDKQFSTCKAKFANGVNFRGFPHMPGNDFIMSYPNSDD